MRKFLRNYRAEFEIGHREQNKMVAEEIITVTYPTTCRFDITLGSYQAANAGTFQFVNLSPTVQAKLWLDNFEIGRKYVTIKFYAGYDKTMPLVFQGNLQECTSERASGSTEWITSMHGFEGGHLFEYGFINSTIAKGTELSDVIAYMLEQDPDTKIGYITPDLPPLAKNKTFIGQTMDILGKEYGGYEVFVEKGKLNILGENDVIPGDLLVITDSSGLLGSPRRSNIYTEVTTLFEPQVRTGQAISLLSDSMPRFNRAYKVIQVHHNGVISAVEMGDLKTILTLAMNERDPRTLKPAKTTTYERQATGKWQKPLKAPYTITSPFGWRTHPITKKKSYHEGIDMGANNNTPIYAVADGKVIMAQWNGGYGKYVKISHGKNAKGQELYSAYGHMAKYLVHPQQDVFAGTTIIGYVNSTGSSTGPHLHFEVWEDNKPVNPLNYI